MRKPVVPRIFGLLALYCAVFVVLVLIQFTKRGNFTQRIGNMAISGQYRLPAEGEIPANPNEHPIEGGVSVYFGGLEFILKNKDEDDGLFLINAGGERRQASPEYMILAGDTARFRFAQGAELIFTSHFAGGSPELQIGGEFAGSASSLEIPFKPQRSSRLRDAGGGELSIYYDGSYYSFNASTQGEENRLLVLKAGAPYISYRAIPETKTFSPGDFIISQARGSQSFNEAITRWKDQSFSYWNRSVSGQSDEDMVVAYSGEALKRGNYKAAVSAVSPDFLSSSRRSYESAVYLGGMDQALLSFTAAERERISRLSRLINEKSLDFLKDSHVFEFFAVRGFVNFLDDGAELIRSIDPATVSLDLSPGIFEGYLDLKQFRPHGDNPFERLVDQTCYVISEGIRKEGQDRVFVFRGSSVDIEFNLRLGEALRIWAEGAGNNDWAALGRSLILSVLSLGDSSGAVPRSLSVSGSGEIGEDNGQRISAARLYRILNPGEYSPHAAVIGSGVSGIWAWTAASAVSAAQENNVLDIAVSFPVGETHHMMIRGVRPFEKLQLYSIDYRTDPQFERYDSSGWVYSSQDQVLVLKMKHRTAAEHIRIFY